jgi:hypothetical protein
MSVNEVSLTGSRGRFAEERSPLLLRLVLSCFRTSCLVGVVMTGELAIAQNIDTRVLNPSQPMRITVNPNVATTLLFPDAIGGAFGLGLVGAGAHENQAAAGSIAVEHPEGSPLMVLHALMPGAKVVMTVLLDGKLYVFDVQSGAEPDLAVTYVKTDPQVRRGEEVTEEEVASQSGEI